MSTYTNKNEFWCLFSSNGEEPQQIYLTQKEVEQEVMRLYGYLYNICYFSYPAESVDFHNWHTVPGNELIDWVKVKKGSVI